MDQPDSTHSGVVVAHRVGPLGWAVDVPDCSSTDGKNGGAPCTSQRLTRTLPDSPYSPDSPIPCSIRVAMICPTVRDSATPILLTTMMGMLAR